MVRILNVDEKTGSVCHAQVSENAESFAVVAGSLDGIPRRAWGQFKRQALLSLLHGKQRLYGALPKSQVDSCEVFWVLTSI